MKHKKNVLKNCMLCSVLVNIDPQKKSYKKYIYYKYPKILYYHKIELKLFMKFLSVFFPFPIDKNNCKKKVLVKAHY